MAHRHALPQKQPIQFRFLDQFVKTIIEKKAILLLQPQPEAEEEIGGAEETPQLQPMIKRKLAPPAPISVTTQVTMPAPAAQKTAPAKPLQKISGLAYINNLLTDPAVQSLECTGPGKPILVNRNGMIQATPFTMDTEDINALMREISERTRIPLVQGLFRAALGNLLITAVISDLIGARFIIQKRYFAK